MAGIAANRGGIPHDEAHRAPFEGRVRLRVEKGVTLTIGTSVAGVKGT
jgi:hypothetical protein